MLVVLERHAAWKNAAVYSCFGSSQGARRIFTSDVSSSNRHRESEALAAYEKARRDHLSPSIGVVLSALKACSSCKDLETGSRIHKELAASAMNNVCLANCLVDMYAKCGSLEEARMVFDGIPQPSLVSWNTIIMGHVQNMEAEAALLLFSRMKREQVFKPDARTFVAVLKACSCLATKEAGEQIEVEQGILLKMKMASLEKGRGIHAQIREAGLDRNIFVASTLLDMYAKCGSMAESRRVFDSMVERDLVSWNALISGYVQVGDGDSALELFCRMQEEGFRPGGRTYVAALKACSCMKGKTEAAKRSRLQIVHAQAVTSGFELDLFVGNSLMDVYVKSGSPKEAREVFDRMPVKNDVSWNTMISGYALNGQSGMALRLFSRMQEEGCAPNLRTYAAAFNACSTLPDSEKRNISKSQALEEGRQIHSQLRKAGLEMDTFAANCLIDMYAKLGSMAEARKVFEEIAECDPVVWTSMISGYVQTGQPDAGLQLFQRMQEDNEAIPQVSTYVAALNACASMAAKQDGSQVDGKNLKHFWLCEGRRIHTDLLRVINVDSMDLFVANTLVNMYAKCGSMLEACKVFDAIVHRDVVSWTVMISGYVHNGDAVSALALFQSMQAQEGLKLDGRAYVAALGACGCLATKEEGRLIDGKLVKTSALGRGAEIHHQVKQAGFGNDRFVANTLVDMYSKCGSMEAASNIFEGILDRDVVSCNAIISGYAQNGESEMALSCYTRMLEENLKPDAVTYIAALKACSFKALRSKGMEIHSHVLRSGLQLSTSLTNSVLDMYVKCGYMPGAQRVFDSMLQQNLVTWNSIIMGYSQCGEAALALKLLSCMQEEGVPPDTRTYIAALNACINLAAKEEGTQSLEGKFVKVASLAKGMAIHSESGKQGNDLDAFVASSLVEMYSKCGSMSHARSVFDKMQQKDVVSWTSLIFGYAQAGQGEEALELFARVQKQGGCKLDAQTYVAALVACTSIAEVEVWSRRRRGGGELVKEAALMKGLEVHHQILQKGYECDAFVANVLVDMYGKCGCMEHSQLVFDAIGTPDVVAWTTIILGYVQNGPTTEALECFCRMLKESCRPNAATYVAAIKACGSLADLETGRRIHSRIRQAGMEAFAAVGNSLIDLYGKCGSMSEAQRVFDSVSDQKDVVTWNSLIAGYALQGEVKTVVELVEQMKTLRLQPNGITFLHLLSACNHAGLVDKAKEYFGSMFRDYEIAPRIEHYTCMVDVLGRASHLEEALAMVRSMPFEPDSKVWMTLLGGCHKWSNAKIGKLAFDSLQKLDKHDSAAYVLMANILTAVTQRSSAEEKEEDRVGNFLEGVKGRPS